MSEPNDHSRHEQKLREGDIDAGDTPIGRMIQEREEVRDVNVHLGHQCVIINVVFKPWTIPTDFGPQYDMRLHSASIVDERPTWKRVFGWGRPCWIQARYVRDNHHVAAEGES